MTLFACVQIPHLPIAVARRDDSALADVPLILYLPGPRATIYDAAPEIGIAAGMPLRQALLRTPQAVCRPAMGRTSSPFRATAGSRLRATTAPVKRQATRFP